MLDAVYVDSKEPKSIVAVKPKPAFGPIFGVATTKENSDFILIKEPPENDPEDYPEQFLKCCETP